MFCILFFICFGCFCLSLLTTAIHDWYHSKFRNSTNTVIRSIFNTIAIISAICTVVFYFCWLGLFVASFFVLYFILCIWGYRVLAKLHEPNNKNYFHCSYMFEPKNCPGGPCPPAIERVCKEGY